MFEEQTQGFESGDPFGPSNPGEDINPMVWSSSGPVQSDASPDPMATDQTVDTRTFYQRFEQCMKTMGMPAPDSLFETAEKAIATIGAIQAAVSQFGTAVTIGELIGAGTLSEVLVGAAGVTASAYVGVCVGCLATAGIDYIW